MRTIKKQMCRSGVAAILMLSGSAWSQVATFTIIPDTTTVPLNSCVGVSDDGLIVAGNASAANAAVLWEQSGGTRFPPLPGGGTAGMVASGLSRNGQFLLGTGANGSGAAVWNATTGLRILPEMPGGATGGTATASTDDGAVIIGQAYGTAGLTAFRYTATGLEPLATHTSDGNQFRVWSVARAMSQFGSHVVGFRRLSSAGGTNAFRWMASTGMVNLGDLPGGTVASEAMAVSQTGAVVVGFSNGINGNEAFMWQGFTGMVGLGDLPGGAFASQANAISGDGTTIVGFGTTGAGIFDTQAFIWTQATGMRLLRDVLTEQGATIPPGVVLSTATSISTDGQVIGGVSYGSTRNYAWVARLGTAATCIADWNADGGIDGSDVEAFILDWENGTADANQDGGVDGADVQAFFLVWEAGGC